MEWVSLHRAWSQAGVRNGEPDASHRLLAALLERVDAAPEFNRLEKTRLLNDMAAVLYAQRRYDEVEPVLRDLLDVRAELLGRRHASTVTSMTNLAAVLARTERFADAEALFREALAAGPLPKPTTDVSTRLAWASCLRKLDRADEARVALEEARRQAAARLPADHALFGKIDDALAAIP